MNKDVTLLDPMAGYCKAQVKIVRKLAKNLTKFWYGAYRRLGLSAIDAIELARQEVQGDINKCDFTINFDGPMLR